MPETNTYQANEKSPKNLDYSWPDQTNKMRRTKWYQTRPGHTRPRFRTCLARIVYRCWRWSRSGHVVSLYVLVCILSGQLWTKGDEKSVEMRNFQEF